MNQLLAQTNLGTLNGIGFLGGFDSAAASNPFAKFARIISVAVGFLTVAASLWFIMQIFAGAFQWLTSGGEKQSLQNAQKRLTHAVIGLLMVILSFALISIIGMIFGIDILGIETLLKTLSPQSLPAGGGGGGGGGGGVPTIPPI